MSQGSFKKSRFSSLDVWAISQELAPHLTHSYLHNIYDLSPKSFLLKFTTKDATQKHISLLVESGVRVHRTSFDRENPNVLPSGFAAKLRKHLRDRRLTFFGQLGFDRVLHLGFGHEARPEAALHLYVELYALGNIILCDWRGQVLALLREVFNGEEKMLGLGLTYQGNVNCQGLTAPSAAELTSHLKDRKESVKNGCKSLFPLFAPFMIEQVILEAGLDPSLRCMDLSVPQMDRLALVSSSLIDSITRGTLKPVGCLVKNAEDTPLDCFPIQVGSTELLPTFNEAVDQYWFQLDGRKQQDTQQQRASAAARKLAAVQAEQEGRIAKLQEQMEACKLKAEAISENQECVEQAIQVIKLGLSNDMSWQELEELLAFERSRGRELAKSIRHLRLKDGLIDLQLPEMDLLCDVDIGLAVTGNIQRQYELRKAAWDKLQRTQSALEQAIRSASRKIRAESLLKSRSQRHEQHLVPKRKPIWFERFNWFLSSDGYLVLAGNDMHQNEQLVKKLLRQGDAYVHADLHGASSVIVKNHLSKERPIPVRTLTEAGAFSLCFSRAWDAKITTSAWWVHANQVSKSAPSGEYLSTGSFVIRGRKNFLPPAQLVLGFGFLFLLDDESAARNRLRRQERAAELVETNMGYLSSLSADQHDDQVTIVGAEPPSNSVNEIEKKEERPKNTKEIEAKKSNNDGKKEPRKKVTKKKYRHQDEEEREARMELLGLRKQVIAQEIVLPKKTTSEKTIDKKSVKTIEEEDDEESLPSFAELSILDHLTACPEPTDVVTHAVAVAGPYSVLSSYRYRVKLLPGTLKRGAAARTALSYLLAEHKKMHYEQREAQLIRAVTDTELNQTMPAKVRLAGPAGDIQKAKKAVQKEKTALKKKAN